MLFEVVMWEYTFGRIKVDIKGQLSIVIISPPPIGTEISLLAESINCSGVYVSKYYSEIRRR